MTETLEIHPSGYVITGSQSDLTLWANRPGERWPCSALARIAPGTSVVAVFDLNGDLIDLEGDPVDLTADELNAWTDDVRKAAGHLRTGDTSDGGA